MTFIMLICCISDFWQLEEEVSSTSLNALFMKRIALLINDDDISFFFFMIMWSKNVGEMRKKKKIMQLRPILFIYIH